MSKKLPAGSITAGVVLVGVGAYLLLRKDDGEKSVVDKIKDAVAPVVDAIKEKSVSEVPSMPKLNATQKQSVDRMPAVAANLRKFWKQGTGDTEEATNAAIQLLLAQSWHESYVGGGWSGPMSGSNNLGAIQCPGCNPATGAMGKTGATWGCAAQKDNHGASGGGTYVCGYKFYKGVDGHTAAENAAIDYLKMVAVTKRPRALAALKKGDLVAYATALSQKEPTSPGKYFEEALPTYIKLLASGKHPQMQQVIAAALGEPIAVFGGSAPVVGPSVVATKQQSAPAAPAARPAAAPAPVAVAAPVIRDFGDVDAPGFLPSPAEGPQQEAARKLREPEGPQQAAARKLRETKPTYVTKAPNVVTDALSKGADGYAPKKVSGTES